MSTSDKPCIECMWQKDNTILINPDGQVYPCCYLGNIHYTALATNHKSGLTFSKYEVLAKYHAQREKFNINSNNIDDILESEWFNETLPESWESYETTPGPCLQWCNNAEK
tara:strand:+ start:1864 stop:2196 length:333 start_codon:yes stop_codon:yes gene_type:complete